MPSSAENRPSASQLSVIIAAYNHFEWLRLVLEGLRNQTVTGFQIVIADDGSDDVTVRQIRDYIAAHPAMNIIHVWQEDDGWRKNLALNKAVSAATGEYLCFLDADCIPAPRWAADHLALATPGTIIAGRRATLKPEWNSGMESITTLSPDWFARWRSRFLRNFTSFPPHCHPARVIRLPIINGKGLLQKRTGNLLGCNFGVFRSDLLDVNGFDERYTGPGLGEDIDLAWRMRFNGAKIYKVSHQALTIHRNHPTATFAIPGRSDNLAILEDNKRRRLTFTPYGINKVHTQDH